MCDVKRTSLALLIFTALFGCLGALADDKPVEQTCVGGVCTLEKGSEGKKAEKKKKEKKPKKEKKSKKKDKNHKKSVVAQEAPVKDQQARQVTCPSVAGGACVSRQTFDDKKSTAELGQSEKTRKLINELYTYEDPYNIPEQERRMIQEKGGDPVYGTCLYESFQVIMDDLPAKVKNGVFYDLGSGSGRLCVQSYLNYSFKKVVGVELSPKRYAYSEVVKDDLAERGLLEKGRTLEFRLEDIAEADIKDATVVYMCSTCYPDKLMMTMVERFSKLKKGLYAITLRPLPEYEKHGLVIAKTYDLPMSWSKGTSPVYVYQLAKKAKKVEKATKEKKPKADKKKHEKKSGKKSKKETLVAQPVHEPVKS